MSVLIAAQTTAFTYQGRLTDGGTPANGSFQMEFRLFDSLAGGVQIGATLTNVPVTVTDGLFSAKLDFGANALSGANRWLEIRVRRNSGESYVTLSPREQIASSPYAVQTLNAQMLGGLPANRYVQTDQNGNVGIGTSTPTTPLDVIGTIRAFSNGSVDVLAQTNGGTNAWARMTMKTPNQTWSIGTSQAFNGDQFYILDSTFGQIRMSAQPNGGPVAFPTNSNGRTLIGEAGCGGGFGAIGFGTTLSGCANYALLGNATHTFVSRPTGGGLYFREANTDQMIIAPGGRVGIGTVTPDSQLTIVGAGTNGFSLGTSGNVGFGGYAIQNRDKGGIVKAMAYVNGDGTLLRCYNGLTGASSGNCGFSTGRDTLAGSGAYFVEFGFQITDRFYSVSVENHCCNRPISVNYSLGPSTTRLRIYVYNTDLGGSDTTLADRPVMVIVY